jgi:hypothetical protein
MASVPAARAPPESGFYRSGCARVYRCLTRDISGPRLFSWWSGKQVTIQVTTHSDGLGRSQMQPDSPARLTSRYPTQRDVAGRNRQAWHARGLGFESP